MKKILLHIPEPMLKELNDISEEEGVPRAEIIRGMLKNMLNQKS